ncbi:hypothetical protein QZH41_002264 [Actinostola sp. cb2023]|nr:hypothetical protein QZH41_002264 [Actinostola sp. cb2023]
MESLTKQDTSQEKEGSTVGQWVRAVGMVFYGIDDLTVGKVYGLRRNKANPKDKNCLEFNLGFGRLRTDTCATCDKLSLKGSEEAAAELRAHQEKAERGYSWKRNDRMDTRKSCATLTRTVSHDIAFVLLTQ